MRTSIRWIVAASSLGIVFYGLANLGDYLVVDDRTKSDVLVVTQADSLDTSYQVGLELLQRDLGQELLLDARTDKIFFGRSQADWAKDYIAKTAPPGKRVGICPMTAHTTAEEVYDVAKCLEGRSDVRSVMLVVHDYHSHRSLSIFSRLLPRYRWSIAAVPGDLDFERQWWRKRRWVRTAMVECQHFLWWLAIDRWRFTPIGAVSGQ